MAKGGLEVIITHINADFDALASMLAAKKLYPDARVVFPGAQEKTLRDFLVRSTFYIFEIDRMKDIDLKRIRRLILVDTRQRSRIGKFAEIAQKEGIELHIYDHHPASDDDLHGQVEFVREVGATTTIMTGLLREKGVELSPDEATILALGIYEDTGSLTFSSTTPEDFHALAYLRQKGAKLNIISDMITKELSAEQIFLLNDLIRSARRIRFSDVEVVIAKASSDGYVGDFAVLVHKLRDMENIDVLFALARMEDRVYLVARSRIDTVNVGKIALEFGGGGHATAASATIKDLTLIQVEERLIEFLREHIRPRRTARDLMSFPVKTIQADESIRTAEEVLSRFNINVLPVMEGESLVGLISRVVVQRAVYHGLDHLPVREYMSTDFVTAASDAPFEEVVVKIVENSQRFLPIMEEEKLVGAVTRTDILREIGAEVMDEHRYAFDTVGKEEARKKDIRKLMEERIPTRIMDIFRRMGEVADDMGIRAFVVGGFVRDLLLRYENEDIDVVVEGDGIEFARTFAHRYGCRFRSHQKFGTAVLIFPNGFKVDVATARTEDSPHPAALPKVELSSIKLDLYRRDFTMNALAVELNPTNLGRLLDFFGGQRDIKDRILRVLHNLSFVEDPTRMLRAIRFEQRYGFRIGKHTLNLFHNAVRMNFLERVEGGRLWHELLMLLREERPLLAIERMAQLGLLPCIHPRISFNQGKRALFLSVEEVLSWFRLLFLDEDYEGWRVYFLALVDSLTDDELAEVCERLSLKKKEIDWFADQKHKADRCLGKFVKERGELRPSCIMRLLEPFAIETLLYMMAKTSQEATKRAISLYITQLRGIRPILKGDDLKALGMMPGPVFREAFEAIREAKADGLIRTKSEEVEFIRSRFLQLDEGHPGCMSSSGDRR